MFPEFISHFGDPLVEFILPTGRHLDRTTQLWARREGERIEAFIESFTWSQVYRLKLELIPGIRKIIGDPLENHFGFGGYFLPNLKTCEDCSVQGDANGGGLFVYRFVDGIVFGICVADRVTVEIAGDQVTEDNRFVDAYYFMRRERVEQLLIESEIGLA